MRRFLLALILVLLSWPALLFGQDDILNPPTAVHKLAWNHDGVNTDHYEIRVNTTAPWINVGKVTETPVPELVVGTYLADVRACNDKMECTQSDKALPIQVVRNTIVAPWTSNKEVGVVGKLGNAKFTRSAGLYTIASSGDIFGTDDAFRYVSQPLPAGAVEMIVHVASQDNTAKYAKAGIMLRVDGTAQSANVFLARNPNGDYEMNSRPTAGAHTVNVKIGQPNITWLKLSRSKTDVVSGSYSADGKTWTPIADVTLPGLTLAGLAVSSNASAVLNTATFDNVSLAAVQDKVVPAPGAPSNVLPRP